jgi:hypothetical protein
VQARPGRWDFPHRPASFYITRSELAHSRLTGCLWSDLQFARPAASLSFAPSARKPVPQLAAYGLKAFNDAVVLGGKLPLDVLAMNVDEYLGR